MGKRIIQQARGKGSFTYRVRRRAFSIKPKYPKKMEGEWEIVKLISSAGHSSPIAKMKNSKNEIVHTFAALGVWEGQKIKFGGNNVGDVAYLKDLENGTEIFNIENNPGDGGKLVRSGGNSAVVVDVVKGKGRIKLRLSSKQEKEFNEDCRATVGETAGQGRLDKPILKAGKQFYIKKAKSKLWPRTSAIKVNAIDHPFGSGRGKRIKSKIAKRFSSPGQKVGLLRPRRTGRRKK